MKNILITSDLHLTDNPRDNYRNNWMLELPKVIKALKPDLLFVIGDLTEKRDHHGAWLVNAVATHFHQLTQLCPVLVLQGNHDYAVAQSPFWAFLAHQSRLSYVAAPTPGKSLQDALCARLDRVLFLPHTYDHKRDWKGLDFTQYDTVFAHQTFHGAKGEHQKLRGIPLTVFPEDVKVYSGDVHVPQTMGQLTYIGAPYSVDFGDSYKPRMLMLTDKGAKSIRCDGPQKRLIECRAGEKLGNDSWPDLAEGDILKVRVTIRPDQKDKWPTLKQQIHDWCEKHGYVPYSIVPSISGKDIEKERERSAPTKSDKQLLTEYGKMRTVSERTIKTGLWIADKV